MENLVGFIFVGRAKSTQTQVWVLTPHFVFLNLWQRTESCLMAFEVFQWQIWHNRRMFGVTNEEIHCNYVWLITTVFKFMSKLFWNEAVFSLKMKCIHLKKISDFLFIYSAVFCNNNNGNDLVTDNNWVHLE